MSVHQPIILILSLLFVTSCSPYGLGGQEAKQVESDGLHLVVQQSKKYPNRWGAGLDETKQLAANTQTLRMAAIRAIETTSGCEVIPESVMVNNHAHILTEVDC